MTIASPVCRACGVDARASTHSRPTRHAPRPATRRLWTLVIVSAALVTPSLVDAQLTRDLAQVQRTQDSVRVTRALERISDAVRIGSPTLRAARATRDLAVARAAAAGPSSPAFVSAGLSEAPARTLDQGNLRLEVGRDLMTGPRRRAERALADIDVRAATIAITLEERRLAGVILRDVIRAAGARRIAVRLAGEDQLLMGAEDGVRGRFGVGEARYVDVLRVRTERLRVQTSRSASLAEVRAARAGVIAVLTGTDAVDGVDALLDSVATEGLADAWRALLPPVPALDSLIALSEEAQLATTNAARVDATRALVLAEQRSQVSAYAGIQRIGQANNGPTFGPSLGVTMTLPFSAARSNRLALAAATQGIATAAIVREGAVIAARARLAAARERYGAALERLATFDAALLRGARDERESALSAYRTGSLSLIELLDFERALSRAEIERIHTLVDAADAWADLLGADDGSAARAFPPSDGR